MSSSESESDDELVGRVLENTIFKGLKTLSLERVHIKDETTLEKIMRSCPLIEYLFVSGCAGFTTTIPVTIFQAEFLTKLYLQGPNLIVTTDQLLLIKPLKTLILDKVHIAEDTLEKIMCGCPLIELLILRECVGLTNIKLKSHSLKHYSGDFYPVNPKSIEIDSPNIETIHIVGCRSPVHTHFSPRLKRLYLSNANLSPQLFESFSSNFPSLEVLELKFCYGFWKFPKIELTVCSIKRLVLIFNHFEPMVISIYAPNIHYFELSARFPPQLIFNTETAHREWKSHLAMLFPIHGSFDDVTMLQWLVQLSKLLNSLSESQISLEVFPEPFVNLKVDQDPNDDGFCKPVPLEDVRVEGSHESSCCPDFLNCLFLICRTRYIVMKFYTINLAELIAFKTIGNEGGLWERDLEEINLQVWDRNSQAWHTFGVERTCFSEFTTSYPMIKFSVKWRD